MSFVDKLNEMGRTYQADYLGGHPEISKKCKCNVTFKGDKIIIQPGLFKTYEIDIKNTKAEFKTREQISRDVTLTRLLLVGVFAFGLKKKRKNQLDYLVFNYEDNVLGEMNVIFSGKKVNAMMKTFSEFKKDTIENKVNKDDTVNKQTSKEDLEYLEKLAELKNNGVITEAEFNQSKKQILGL